MKIDFEKLLKPITEENPCGIDISEESDFYILEEKAKGKQETQFSEAEPPDWKEILKLSLSLFEQSKDIWVAYYILCSAVNLYADEGMVGGLSFLQNLLEKYWDKMHPRFEDDIEIITQQRMNVVKDTLTPFGVFALEVKKIKLSQSSLGNFTYKDIQIAKQELPPEKETNVENLDSILAAIKSTNEEYITRIRGNFAKTKEIVIGLKAYLNAKELSTDCKKALEDFIEIINKILIYLAPKEDPKIPQYSAAEKSDPSLSDNNNVPTGKIVSGISDYKSIIGLLEEICRWYEKNEPSSPVPLFIERAKALVGKNFANIIEILAPNAMRDITYLFNEQQDKVSIEKEGVPNEGFYNSN